MMCNYKILETPQMVTQRQVEYKLWYIHSVKPYASTGMSKENAYELIRKIFLDI